MRAPLGLSTHDMAARVYLCTRYRNAWVLRCAFPLSFLLDTLAHRYTPPAQELTDLPQCHHIASVCTHELAPVPQVVAQRGHAREHLSESARVLQDRLELASTVERHHAARSAIVTSAKKLAANKHSWHARTARQLREFGAKRVAALNLVELQHRVRGAIVVKDLLGLDAEGSGGEGEHHRG